MSGGFLRYGGEKSLPELGRSFARQLGRDGVVVDWIESGVRLTSADSPHFDVYAPAIVRAPELLLEEIAVVSFRDVPADRSAYWTITPYYLDPNRRFSLLSTGVSTATRRLRAHVPLVFEQDRALALGGGVVIRFAPTGAAPDLDATVSVKIRRGA